MSYWRRRHCRFIARSNAVDCASLVPFLTGGTEEIPSVWTVCVGHSPAHEIAAECGVEGSIRARTHSVSGNEEE
jgi:hypothetical protein